MKMKISFTRDYEVRDKARDKGRDLFARKFRIFTNTVEGTVSATASCMCHVCPNMRSDTLMSALKERFLITRPARNIFSQSPVLAHVYWPTDSMASAAFFAALRGCKIRLSKAPTGWLRLVGSLKL